MASVPGTFRQYAANLVIRVEDFVDEETEEEMDLESPFELLGLYRGVSLNNKSVSVSTQDMDMVFLYRRPILDYWCETGEDLAHLVRHVLIHEIGHHFGFSDDDMDAIEDQA
ncbi:MAG: metallopeptidase family protein [Rhodospirillales bacterium]